MELKQNKEPIKDGAPLLLIVPYGIETIKFMLNIVRAFRF